MATTQQDKPGAKARQRGRKTDQRAQKNAQPAVASPKPEEEMVPDQMTDMAATEEAEEKAMNEFADAVLRAEDAALSGEILPPEVRASTAAQPLYGISLQAIATAYADYARKSWQASRQLVERLMTTRSFDEAVEVQGEFARQTCANFVVHSQKIGGLYGEFTRQFFRPLESLATEWTRFGR
jgi:hypothetical protein